MGPPWFGLAKTKLTSLVSVLPMRKDNNVKKPFYNTTISTLPAHRSELVAFAK
jgi:hypothetical protein